jgi:hypothetical protein
MLGFGGLVVDPDLGSLSGSGRVFLHGVWDFVYFKLDRVGPLPCRVVRRPRRLIASS